MYTLCVTEKAAEQQRQFESALLALLMEMPYDSITISELCRRAGFSRKVFYRLYEQKADVVYGMIDRALMDYESFEPELPTAGILGIRRFFRYWKEKKLLLDGLDRCSGSPLLLARSVRHVLKEDANVSKTFGTDSFGYEEETMVFFLSGLFSLVLHWHETGYSRSVEEMAELVQHLLNQPPIKRDSL